ncbi:MAG: hypothetical protein II850_06400 [Fibrobacter sp.]|nr:hypothetical protein [Fibrobacter sp.]
MERSGIKKYLTGAAFAFITAAGIIGCSNTSSSDTAGIFIETNTGNKQTARIAVSTASLDLSAGDTIVIHKETTDTVGDTAYVSIVNLQRIADSIECVSGIMVIDSIPVGLYDSVQIHPVSGKVRSASVNWSIAADTLNFDTALDASFDGVVAFALPQGFEDLANADEKFDNMPIAVRIEGLNKPCLQDFDGNVILLDRSKGDTTLYWGVLPQVIFNDNGEIQLDIISNCQATNDLNLALGRHAEHFDDFEASETAQTSGLALTSVMGGARWTDSTDNWTYIGNFEPFVDGNSIALSIWFKMDSTQANNYTQIVSAKKDSSGYNSTGITLQQRGTTSAINLRIDAEDGDYNKLVGRADGLLDNEWHNYAFIINGDSVTTFVDGKINTQEVFEHGNGFANVKQNIAIGGKGARGGIDELFFFDGTQSENWMRLFYALQVTAR